MFNMSSYAEWQGGVVNRNYQILQSLLKSSEVNRLVAVDFLPFSFKRMVRHWLENIFCKPKYKIIYQDLTTRAQWINEKLIVFSTIDSFLAPKKVVPKLNLILNKLGRQNSIKSKRVVISYFPMFTDYFGQLNQDLNVFEAVDNWLEHPSYRHYKKRLENNYQLIAQKSDLVFTVAEPLVGFFKSLGREKDIYWIPNGVDAEHWQKFDNQVPNDLAKIPHPIIGYLGIIQDRIDTNLLEYLAEKNTDKSLVLVGPTWPEFLKKWRESKEIKKLRRYKNVYFLGRKSYQDAPKYIHQFDVAIIPHKVDKFIQFTHSMKMFDYLACGKPIVTTPASGVEKFSHLLYIAQNYLDFNNKIQKALQEDNSRLKELRIQAARENSWQSRSKKIIRIINEQLV